MVLVLVRLRLTLGVLAVIVAAVATMNGPFPFELEFVFLRVPGCRTHVHVLEMVHNSCEQVELMDNLRVELSIVNLHGPYVMDHPGVGPG